jgi:RNA polymerase sigma factor (sigma-70 family)
MRREVKNLVEEILAALPEESRRLLEWKYRDGKTWEEIANALGTTLGRARSKLEKIHREIKGRIGDG